MLGWKAHPLIEVLPQSIAKDIEEHNSAHQGAGHEGMKESICPSHSLHEGSDVVQYEACVAEGPLKGQLLFGLG